MRRTRLYQILICLLCLFPVWSQAQSLTQYEYWIDDNFSARKSAGLSGYEADIDVGIDASRLGNGLHKLCLRVQQSDGMYSPVTTHYFFKAQVSNGGKLEYWFDGNRKKINTVDCHVSSDGEAYLYTSGLDLTAVTPGYHTMFYRFTNDDGTTSSAVSVASVIVTSSLSNGGKLEYWFDDDRENVYTVGGKVASTGDALIFNSDLDLKDVSQGMHRMYYRLVDAKGKPNSAVSMTPIMVKSMYNVANPEALTVTEQAYWFDDEEPEVRIVSGPKNSRDLPLTLDARKLSDGKHTLHLQYGNSADVWNGPVDFPFTKEKVDPPMIVANSSEKDGEVTLTFTSIPYGQVYTIVRKYPSGTESKVEDIKTTEHPTVFKSIDKVGPGTYTYYIKGKYFDADGVIQEVLSKEMSVTVDNVSSDVKRGTISGKIKNDGRTVGPGDVFYVYINGEKAQPQSEYGFKYDGWGGFCINNIPYNTEISIGIKQKHYKFEDVSFIVNEKTTSKPLYFNGTWTEEEDIFPENDAFDLELSDKIHITPNGWEIPIRNLSSKIWSGNLIVKVISKAVKEEFDKDYTDEVNSAMDFLYYKSGICYKTIAEMPVDIQGCRDGSQVVILDITDMPYADKNEDYYVYVFSKKNDSEETKMLQASSGIPNPQVQNFNPFDYKWAIKKGVISYIEEYTEVFKYMKKFAEWGDPFKLGWKSAEEAWKNYIKTLEANRHDADARELIEDKFDAYLRSAGMLMNCFYGEMNQLVVKELTDNNVYKASDKISKLYDLVNSAYKTSQVDDNHKFFEIAKLVLKYSADLGVDPVLKCYKTFFEVGEAMVDAIEDMTKNIHDHDIWNKLHDGQGVYKIKIRKYTDHKSRLYFEGRDFYEHTEGIHHITHDGQIKSISIQLIDPQYEEHNLIKQVEKENVELTDDGIVIKNVKFPRLGAQPQKVDAWMTIVWKNDRVTHIPLLNDDFVKLENFDRINSDYPLTMTVELQSGCYLHEQGIPNHLSFVKP